MTDPLRNQQTHEPHLEDDEIDLSELFRALWESKWLISSITLSSTLIVLVIALVLPNIYRAEALLAPNDQEAVGGLSALAGQYGGLASLAGINIGDGSANKTALGLEILKSRKFIAEFVEHHNILVPLIATKRWDSRSGALEIDPDNYDVVSETWVRNVRLPKKTIPSSQEAHEEFMKILSVSQNKITGFITVSVEHHSPSVAKQWVDWLIDDLNSSIMQQDVAEAEQAIAYLNKQIENTSLSDLQNVFFNLIEEQTKTIMLAKVTDEYLLKTLDPAVSPEEKSKPNRILIVILGTAGGLFFAMLIVFVRNPMRAKS